MLYAGSSCTSTGQAREGYELKDMPGGTFSRAESGRSIIGRGAKCAGMVAKRRGMRSQDIAL